MRSTPTEVVKQKKKEIKQFLILKHQTELLIILVIIEIY